MIWFLSLFLFLSACCPHAKQIRQNAFEIEEIQERYINGWIVPYHIEEELDQIDKSEMFDADGEIIPGL